jgi:hypothetical protein
MTAEKERVLELTRRHVAPHRVDVWEAFGTQLVIGRREGYRLWDLDGRELIDLHLNGGTFNLGHRHPEVVEAMVTAASTLDVGTPGELTYTVFASGGSEAIDVAIKSARRATGRRRVVTLAAGYHGRTGLSGAAGEDAGAAYFLSDLPEHFAKVPFGDLDAIAAELSRGDVAAVLLETVPATYGFPVPPDGYLPAVKALCDEHDALYIADEVQTGLGRTGRLWGVETFGVEPDILVSGKGLSGGMYPIAATVMTPRAAGWLHENGWGHVSTFGGAEIGCRVAERVLEITTRPAVTERIQQLIGEIGRGLSELRDRQPYLVEVRQSGLVIGLRVDHPDGAVFLQQELYELGVWAIASGFDQSVLQFKPGLLLDDALVASVLERLETALARARDTNRPVPSRHVRSKSLSQ